jgi:hypothetical protein
MPDITHRPVTGMATPVAETWPSFAPQYLGSPALTKLAALGTPSSTMGASAEAPSLEPTPTRADRVTTTRVPPGSSRNGGPGRDWLESGFDRPEPLSRSQFGSGGPAYGMQAPEGPSGPPRLPGGPTRPALPPGGEMAALPSGRLSPQFAEAVETVVAKL